MRQRGGAPVPEDNGGRPQSDNLPEPHPQGRVHDLVNDPLRPKRVRGWLVEAEGAANWSLGGKSAPRGTESAGTGALTPDHAKTGDEPAIASSSESNLVGPDPVDLAAESGKPCTLGGSSANAIASVL